MAIWDDSVLDSLKVEQGVMAFIHVSAVVDYLCERSNLPPVDVKFLHTILHWNVYT